MPTTRDGFGITDERMELILLKDCIVARAILAGSTCEEILRIQSTDCRVELGRVNEQLDRKVRGRRPPREEWC